VERRGRLGVLAAAFPLQAEPLPLRDEARPHLLADDLLLLRRLPVTDVVRRTHYDFDVVVELLVLADVRDDIGQGRLAGGAGWGPRQKGHRWGRRDHPQPSAHGTPPIERVPPPHSSRAPPPFPPRRDSTAGPRRGSRTARRGSTARTGARRLEIHLA